MYLNIDDQTIVDLRIFSQGEAEGIYDLYNQCHTRGGERLLEEMFRRPLSDEQEINRRSEVIEQFARGRLKFPFASELFGMAEKYLQSAETSSPSQIQKTALGEKEISGGVSAMIALLKEFRQFIETELLAGMTKLTPERVSINNLLGDPAFAPLYRETGKSKLSYTAVTAYDLLFRTRETGKIIKLFDHIYHLDVYLSIAKVAVERNFIFPKALPGGKALVKLEGVYHPGLKNPVGNDISLDPDMNLVFLTGANMAGKSTFLRSFSTAVYIAHMGFPVAAKRMEFSVFDGIYTTINLPDNLGMGASHFYAEVLRVKKIARELHSGKSLLVVFDELFRGTNVKDAHEATVAIAGAFARNKKSLFIISSHIVEAGDELKKEPGIDFLYLPTVMKGHMPEYTYTFERGTTDDRHGMIIIGNEGILEKLKNGRKRAPLLKKN